MADRPTRIVALVKRAIRCHNRFQLGDRALLNAVSRKALAAGFGWENANYVHRRLAPFRSTLGPLGGCPDFLALYSFAETNR